jgi:hypothetical protein
MSAEIYKLSIYINFNVFILKQYVIKRSTIHVNPTTIRSHQ